MEDMFMLELTHNEFFILSLALSGIQPVTTTGLEVRETIKAKMSAEFKEPEPLAPWPESVRPPPHAHDSECTTCGALEFMPALESLHVPQTPLCNEEKNVA